MSKPDEALLWAREDAAQQCEKCFPVLEQAQKAGVDFPAEYRAGLMDTHLDDPVRAYRAGQAASAERIKALEEALRALVVLHDSPTRPGADYAVARALLKEADQ
jgi:hypothetical protein